MKSASSIVSKTVRRGIVILWVSVLLLSGCSVYYNTFYHAQKSFNSAESKRKKSAGGKGPANLYHRAIEKARKVTDNHPNSKYYDDALFVLGVSYYYIGEYGKSERRLRELLANYDDAKLIKEARLYLAKAKLHLNDIDEAMVVFEDIFNADYERDYKAQAAMALGEYQFENDNWAGSKQYFMSVRDSLGDKFQKLRAQLYLADGYFKAFRFGDALGGYLQALELDPDKNQKYHSLHRAALASYRMMRIADGHAYLTKLIEDELYYDSSSVLKLMIARGYEYEDDIDQAEATFADVANSAEQKKHQGEAQYRLGLIYQYDYDKLSEAKEFYDLSAKTAGSTEWGRQAVQKSAAIGKVDKYKKEFRRDSTTTQEQIDAAAYTQYQLSELYWFQLNKPDTAMLEMRYLIDSFPSAYEAPRAAVALAAMYREIGDTEVADSLLKQVLKEYSSSDYVPEALHALGLKGTAADTGYAEIYYHLAEDWFVDSANYDSAKFYYQYVVDSFPYSKYNLQSRFNILFVSEVYDLPGDSSLVLAYQEFIDSFPDSPLSREAGMRLTVQTPQHRRPARDEHQEQDQPSAGDTALAVSPADTATDSWVTSQLAIYKGPNGESLTDLDESPTLVEEPFELPIEAYTMKEQAIYISFHVLVDFSGKVVDLSLEIPSSYDEINEQAEITVASMTFDPMKVSQIISRFGLQEAPDGRGYWFVFKYLIENPNY